MAMKEPSRREHPIRVSASLRRRAVVVFLMRMIAPHKRLAYALGYIELGLVREARGELARLSTQERNTPEATAVLVELAMAEDDWKQVIRLAPRVTKVAPSVERPWIAWAYALREVGKIEEAREVLLRGAETIEKPTVLVDYNLACYDCLLGDRDDARRRLARVFKREPGWRDQAAEDPDLKGLDWADVA
jgi:predicted Zn-dependent protease